MSHLINRRDLDFLLYELLDTTSLCERERFASHDRATFDAVIDAAETLAVEAFADHAAKLDANEPEFDGERVHIIPEVKKALEAYIEGGFLGTAFDESDGGLQLPYTVSQSVAALFSAANIGTAGYPFLTGAAANLLKVVGSEAQQQRYMRPMIAGRFFGTMCLSEPQAGSSLGDIRTRAVPDGEGGYRLKGNKMWISCGEHDLSENIVHLVLARVEGDPPGTKGISLFVVPKFRINDDGSLGPRNDVRLVGLNHKMGYRGTVNTVLSFGDNDDCRAELVGEQGKGLAGMFHMMNEARIGVGMGASVLGYSGYLHSLTYARERPQGRSPAAPDPAKPPVPIIRHADVRRMLLAQKAYAEGGLALCLYCASLVDRQATTTGDDAERDRLGLLLDILTPVAKSWPSEYGLEANKLAIQVLGGYGYTREYPVERLYRDNRLNPIHEGTYGIQAIDLLGRKVTMREGAALKLLLRQIGETAQAVSEDPELQGFAAQLADGIDLVAETTRAVADRSTDAETYLANASAYLDMLGHLVLAWIWLRQAQLARAAEPASTADADFYAGKLQATRFFFNRELPKIRHWADIVARGEDSALSMRETWF
ncbi:acyl-CoA dehydrogenase [Algiphilus aromaticivorans]|uniref:acyl-CoA dehydrogenase n=1 Tax=Algiphilus aromaticivorans TaxID=382454 RepID=UPI0006950563|nr:acyl-CoA dehydrogenase [Algiphilus aromaticivorans]